MADVWSPDSSNGSRRRRKKQSRAWYSRFARLDFLRRFWRWLEKTSYRPFLTALPLFSYMVMGSIYSLAVIQGLTDINSYRMWWLPGMPENAGEKLAAELLKQKFQIVSYLLTFFLLAFRLKDFIAFFKREKTLLALVVVLLATSFASEYPDRVIISVVHLTLGIIATWLYFYDERRRRNIVYSACLITLLPIMVTLGGSFLLFFAHHDSSIQAVLAGQRFSGVAGNPNTLGGVCIAGAWSAFGLISLTRFKSRRMVLLLLAVIVIMFNAWATGSATTLTIISSMVLMLVGHHLYGVMGKKIRAVSILVAFTLFFGVLIMLAVQQNINEYAFAATDAVGKDLTLTGRTDLWGVAWEAFSERPILGWGYDNHETVMETALYGVPYNHYHNGYLDSLVSGGVLFGAVILFSYGSFLTRYLSLKSRMPGSFVLVVAVAAVSIQNMTEYSLFRSNTAIWQIYFIVFVALAIETIFAKKASKPVKPVKPAAARGRRGRSSSRRLSW